MPKVPHSLQILAGNSFIFFQYIRLKLDSTYLYYLKILNFNFTKKIHFFQEINLDDTLIYEQQNDNLPHHNHHRYDETDDAVGMGIKGGTELQ